MKFFIMCNISLGGFDLFTGMVFFFSDNKFGRRFHLDLESDFHNTRRCLLLLLLLLDTSKLKTEAEYSCAFSSLLYFSHRFSQLYLKCRKMEENYFRFKRRQEI